jgi:hypothetical protein
MAKIRNVESRTKDFNLFYAETKYLRACKAQSYKKRVKCKRKACFSFQLFPFGQWVCDKFPSAKDSKLVSLGSSKKFGVAKVTKNE